MKAILKTIALLTFAVVLGMPTLASAQSLSELEQELRELEDLYQELLDEVEDRAETERPNAASRRPATGIYGVLPLICTEIDDDLRYGQVDQPGAEEVKALQDFLKAVGDYTYPRATGYFGLETVRAVTRFQVREGIRPAAGQGVVEATTRARIESISCADEAEDEPALTPGIIPSGRLGVSYLSEIQTENVSGSAVVVLAEGRLPAGLTFQPTLAGAAVISGVPRAAGVNTFTVWAVTGEGLVAKRTYQLVINDRDGALFGP